VGVTKPTPNVDTYWHYANALLSILHGKALWATAAAFMNDTEEMRHGLVLLKRVWTSEKGSVVYKGGDMRRAIEQCYEIKPFCLPDVRPAIDRVLQEVEETLVETSTFTICASIDGDSLSRWRAYGGS
jgi:hypothetical protein